MRRESIGEILEKQAIPLKPRGSDGTPAKVIEIPENVTVVESKQSDLNI